MPEPFQITRRGVLALAGAALSPALRAQSASLDWAAVVRRNDEAVATYLERQITDPANPWRGSLPDTFELNNPGSASGVFVRRGRRWLNRGGVVDHVLGGWTIAAAQRYVSGGLDVGTAPNSLSNVLFNGGKRANPTGQELQTGINRTDLDPANPSALYYNSGAFALAGEFDLGTGSLYYGDLRRPPIFQENLSIQKQFRLFTGGDRSVLFSYRADMFNLFNRTNFTINSVIGNTNFGRATAPQNGPRLITMGLRLEF